MQQGQIFSGGNRWSGECLSSIHASTARTRSCAGDLLQSYTVVATVATINRSSKYLSSSRISMSTSAALIVDYSLLELTMAVYALKIRLLFDCMAVNIAIPSNHISYY